MSVSIARASSRRPWFAINRARLTVARSSKSLALCLRATSIAVRKQRSASTTLAASLINSSSLSADAVPIPAFSNRSARRSSTLRPPNRIPLPHVHFCHKSRRERRASPPRPVPRQPLDATRFGAFRQYPHRFSRRGHRPSPQKGRT